MHVMETKEGEMSSKFLQDLSARLAATATSSTEYLLPSGFDKEMWMLSESLQQIALFLKVSKPEERKTSASNWFYVINDIVNEIDNILPSFSAGGGRAKMSTNLNSALNLKAIRIKLYKILKRKNFNILQQNTTTDYHGMITKMSIRNCPLEPLCLQGEDDQKAQEMITMLLLSAKDVKQGGTLIIPIDRPKGKKSRTRGPSQLARAIFDDKRIQLHFFRRIWISASEIVNSDKLSGLISKPASTMFWVHKTFNIKGEEQPVLLVLDDIRKKTRIELRGSWIRDDTVLDHPWYFLDRRESAYHRRIVLEAALIGRLPRLSRDDMPSLWNVRSAYKEELWELFKVDAGYVAPELESIGRKIVENIAEYFESHGMIDHVGLSAYARGTIRLLGDIACQYRIPRYWQLILEGEIWRLPLDEDAQPSFLLEACYAQYPS